MEIVLQLKQKEAFIKSQEIPVLFFGGARGGGKSHFLRAREIYRRLRFPNTKGLIVRKTYPELMSNHVYKFFEEYPETVKWYNKSEKKIFYPNGSVTEFSYINGADDVFNYQGREYEDISIDEATQHREQVFKILRASNRSSNIEFSKAGGRVSMVMTGNPGGVGHSWVKRIFVDRVFSENENPDDFAFVQSFVQDNKALLKADPDYVKRLEDLPEYLRKAYLYGDWNIHAGQAFTELTMKHIIKPFELPRYTNYFAGYDNGFNHPFSFILFAVTPSGEVYVVKYLKDRLKRSDEIARMILDITKEERKMDRLRIYCGTDIWARGRDGAPTIAEQFINNGLTPANNILLAKAVTDRVNGVAEIRKYIAEVDGNIRLHFFENCREVFNNLSEMQFDDKKPEDVMKMDADDDGNGGDDLYDAFRYALISRAIPKKVPDNVDVTSAKYLMDMVKKQSKKEALSKW
jgi:phage terminase large subunit